MQKVKNSILKVMKKVHPNNDILIKKKTEWVRIVRKHLKDLVETADTDAITEKSPAPVKDIGLVSQGNITTFSLMTSSFYTEVEDVILAGHCDNAPDTRSRALGIQPVNLELSSNIVKGECNGS
ncbi:putative Very large inducible GTPASE (VLIG)-type guanine nucleotide-binding (G) [Helianthus anomalus]